MACLRWFSKRCITRDGYKRDASFGNTGICSPRAPKQTAPNIRSRTSGVSKVSVTKRVSSVKPSLRVPLPGETTLIAIIAILFLVLHIVAGVTVHNASPMSPSTAQEKARASSYD
jgi:hypothetical protein